MSKGLPIRRAQFKTAAFLAWLAENGAEVGTPTNLYEVVRYRAYHAGSVKALTHIVYAKESGLLNFQGASAEHYGLFQAGLTFGRGLALAAPGAGNQLEAASAPKPTVKQGDDESKAARRRAKLLARDGDECWFCGRAMGDDCTIEHLVARSKGGVNHLDNYALAHRACNNAAADKPLVEKIAMRERARQAQEIAE
ncbi:MAG: HNH endonuclease [Sphingomonas sp.]|uniref:HNH endonuclease n=1 Tax=Sphingomonas sp. TaxID=28214 RepID=UPI001B1C67CA|nr:HNH endonuclease signature motif containing protein [Sphingomonas sp.]MBO9624130.1 HNH endonuclease [Sphingomonas sp.]